jgi:sporulation protein YlmC with PRC-barrel domain
MACNGARKALPLNFYSLDELRDAEVYDSEGLFYGVLDGLVFRDETMFLRVALEFSSKQPIVDVERLTSMLRERGVQVSSGDPLEYLVARAREEGVDIPYRTADKRVRLTKALVPIDEVAVVDVKKLQRGLEEKTVKIVVLRTPREARYRGRAASHEKPGVPSPEDIRGKLVVSLSEGVLGYAEDIVIGPGTPGLRVSRGQGVMGYINWIAFLNALKRQGYIDVYEKLAEYRDPLTAPRLDISLLPSIERLLVEVKASKKIKSLLEEYIVRQPLRESFKDLAWGRVLKINDIILVK